MPNIKSAKKRVKVTEVKTLRNKMVKTSLKTCINNFKLAVSEGDKEKVNVAYKLAIKKIDQAAAKGIIHKNNAARKKSQLTHELNSISA